MKQIRQAITDESLFRELQSWCDEGAERKTDKLRIMSAFTSGAAIQVLEPFFDIFLSNGNSIEIITGIDKNGTDKYAIARLLGMQEAYSRQFSCHIFHAPSRTGIFHPKLFLHHKKGALSAVVGSGNLTLGGLGNNFESLLVYKNISRGTGTARELCNIWDAFAYPKKPLNSQFLRKLTRAYAKVIYKRLPEISLFEGTNRDPNDFWQPVSRIHLPISNARIRRNVELSQVSIRSFLIIDVLAETRETQMQLPLHVVEKFFAVPSDQAESIQLSYVRGNEITQPIERRIVISGGKEKRRLMRRIEMPIIAGKARPLAAIFIKTGTRKFAVALILKGTDEYRMIDGILKKEGQQRDYAVRRFYIGAGKDPFLRELRTVVMPGIESLLDR